MVKKYLFVLLLIFLSIFVSCEQQQEQSTYSVKPLQFYYVVSPPKVSKNELFEISGYIKNNGDFPAVDMNISIFNLDSNYFEGVSTFWRKENIEKNVKKDMISADFNISNIKYKKDVYSETTFPFYLKIKFNYTTTVKSLICISLNNPNCKGNVLENKISIGYLDVVSEVKVLADTPSEYILFVAYRISSKYSDVDITKVNITSFILQNSPENTQYNSIILAGKQVNKYTQLNDLSNKEVELSDGKMLIQFNIKIDKSKLSLTDTVIPVLINLTYTVQEYLPAQITVFDPNQVK
ncbi:MAG: hypothetical protein QXR30_02440 [Candidatus Woesearchaeota archaeon]